MEKINYFLALEKRIGDYNIIDINKLDICDNNYMPDIASIDMFTSKYTIDEIRESIKRANMVKYDYLVGDFKIVSDKKHRLPILTKDKYEIIRDFQNNDMEISKDFKNKLYGSYKKIIEKNFKDSEFKNNMLDKFNTVLKEGNKEEIFKLLETLPYDNIRDFYLTIYKELDK